MKKYLYVFLLCSVSVIANALTLEGEWKSDKEKTIDWNRKNLKLSEEYLSRLSLILGHNHIYYSETTICNYFEPFKINGKESGGYALPESNYKIIARNNYGFIVEETLDTKEKILYMLIFESENVFYGVMLDTEDFGRPGAREYYSRTTSNNSPKWGQKTCYPL
jgi:hypothetical protein